MSLRQSVLKAECPYSEKYLRRNIPTAKGPYGELSRVELSHGEKSYGEKSYGEKSGYA